MILYSQNIQQDLESSTAQSSQNINDLYCFKLHPLLRQVHNEATYGKTYMNMKSDDVLRKELFLVNAKELYWKSFSNIATVDEVLQ